MCVYFSKNHRKFLMKAHVIFVVKYRKSLMSIKIIDETIKSAIISTKGDFVVELMESDKDHIHMLINYDPKISITQIIRRLKQQSTSTVWKNHKNTLHNYFWRERTFWTDGYFACSVGNASDSVIRNYIENQG